MAADTSQPIVIYRYRLTPADALAYERLPGELGGRDKIVIALSFVILGGLAGFLDGALPDPQRWLLIVTLALVWLLFLLAGQNLQRMRRASRRADREGETTVEEWGDHLAISSQAGTTYLPWELIAKVLATREHVCLLYHGGPLIMPLRSFEDAGQMAAFASFVEGKSHDAAP